MAPMLFFASLASLVLTSSARAAKPKLLDLIPGDLDLEIDKPFRAKCSICKNLQPTYNASHIFFKFLVTTSSSSSSSSKEKDDCNLDTSDSENVSDDIGSKNNSCNTTSEYEIDCASDAYEGSGTSVILVESKYVRIVNQYEVELLYPRATKNLDEGTLECFIQVDSVPKNICAWAHILVGEKPHMPVIMNYTVRNWDTLDISWQTRRTNQVYKTRYSLWYKNSEHGNYTKCSKATSKKRARKDVSRCASHCQFPVQLSLDRGSKNITFKVKGENMIGTVYSDEITADLYDLVTPDPVLDLDVSVNVTTTCVIFKSPKSDAWLEYELYFSCNRHTFRTAASNLLDIRECVNGLPAFSFCEISVRAKPHGYGRWGDWSKKDFNTPENVPLMAPVVCPSCFEVLNTEDHNKKDIRVFIQPLSVEMARGNVINYLLNISTLRPIKPRNFPSNNSILTVEDLNIDATYHLTVVAATGAGYNDSIRATPIVVCLNCTSELCPKPNNITAFILKSGTVQISWSSQNPHVTGFTVFWCKGEAVNTCKDEMQSLHLSPNHTHYNITNLPTSELQKYNFGVALETDYGYSSGVIWSQCLYNISYVDSPPKLEIELLSDKLQLRFLRETTCPIGYAYAFLVTYCILKNEANTDDGCMSHWKKFLVNSTETSYKFQDLTPENKYFFVVSSQTVAGPSLINTSIQWNPKTMAADTSPTVLVAVLLTVAGLVSLCVLVPLGICCKSSFTKWRDLDVKMPPTQAHHRSSEALFVDSSDSNILPYASTQVNNHSEQNGFAHNSGHLISDSESVTPALQMPLLPIPDIINSASSTLMGTSGSGETHMDDDDTNMSSGGSGYKRGCAKDKIETLLDQPAVEPQVSPEDVESPLALVLPTSDACSSDITNSAESPSEDGTVTSESGHYAQGRLMDEVPKSLHIHSPGVSSDADFNVIELPVDDSPVNCSNGSSSSSSAPVPLNITDDSNDSQFEENYANPDDHTSDERSDDEYSSGSLSSAGYAVTCLQDKEKNPLLDTPAEPIHYTDSGSKGDYSTVSLMPASEPRNSLNV